ncbi:9943_t:CDS:2 [Ambispora leptoticha]|uniref:9943_t:CDS:1 n=1 Tax=Ambispora leptoticha TaxID=144679 RepID=A0A9N9F453_9GLOM|nr:9943_t:CDS:2 [Ambispora leptoticha]
MAISTSFAIKAVDSSGTVVPVSSYQCVKKDGYGRIIIRGYFESYCGDSNGKPGGDIDKSFVKSYTNAVNAGFTDIDVYMFPCTGNPPCGKKTCKSPKDQVDQLTHMINTTKINGDKNIIVRRVWLDVETAKNPGGWPNTAANRKTLLDFQKAWQDTKWNWGIYSNYYEWTKLTGDKNWVLDSSRPLWTAKYDNIIDLTKGFVPYGGWKKPTGKQYAGTTHLCNQEFDLSIF